MQITKSDLIKMEACSEIAKYLLANDKNPSYIPDDIRWYLYNKYRYRCAICGSLDNLVIDHVIPVSKGGTASLKNLQVLCSWCNGAKGDHWLHWDSYKYHRVIVCTERNF